MRATILVASLVSLAIPAALLGVLFSAPAPVCAQPATPDTGDTTSGNATSGDITTGADYDFSTELTFTAELQYIASPSADDLFIAAFATYEF